MLSRMRYIGHNHRRLRLWKHLRLSLILNWLWPIDLLLSDDFLKRKETLIGFGDSSVRFDYNSGIRDKDILVVSHGLFFFIDDLQGI